MKLNIKIMKYYLRIGINVCKEDLKNEISL